MQECPGGMIGGSEDSGVRTVGQFRIDAGLGAIRRVEDRSGRGKRNCQGGHRDGEGEAPGLKRKGCGNNRCQAACNRPDEARQQLTFACNCKFRQAKRQQSHADKEQCRSNKSLIVDRGAGYPLWREDDLVAGLSCLPEEQHGCGERKPIETVPPPCKSSVPGHGALCRGEGGPPSFPPGGNDDRGDAEQEPGDCHHNAGPSDCPRIRCNAHEPKRGGAAECRP